MPEWRNWQTRTVQGRVRSGECGFDPHLRHLADGARSGSAPPAEMRDPRGRPSADLFENLTQ